MKQKAKSNGRGVKTSVEFLSKVKTPTPVHSFVNIRDYSKGTGTNICNQQPQNHHQSPFPTQDGSGCPLCA
jgi:hypothetical protein